MMEKRHGWEGLESFKPRFSLAMVAHGRQRQEGHHRTEANLDYVASSRPTRAAQHDSTLKKTERRGKKELKFAVIDVGKVQDMVQIAGHKTLVDNEVIEMVEPAFI